MNKLQLTVIALIVFKSIHVWRIEKNDANSPKYIFYYDDADDNKFVVIVCNALPSLGSHVLMINFNQFCQKAKVSKIKEVYNAANSDSQYVKDHQQVWIDKNQNGGTWVSDEHNIIDSAAYYLTENQAAYGKYQWNASCTVDDNVENNLDSRFASSNIKAVMVTINNTNGSLPYDKTPLCTYIPEGTTKIPGTGQLIGTKELIRRLLV